MLLLVSIIVCNSCTTQKELYVEGALLGKHIHTKVDHELAATMITNRQDSSVIKLFETYNNIQLDNEILENITKEYSLDVATLFLIEKLYNQEKNRQIQDYYLSVIDTLFEDNLDKQLSFLQNFYIVFIPAFNYNSNNGNYFKQRELLDSAKMPYEMIKTDPFGRAEDNAEIIAEQLREINRLHSNVIVISASKGSLETAIALRKVLNSDDLNSLKVWINVCGILKGSPVADFWATPFRKWWLSCGIFFMGKRINLNALLSSLSYKQRIQEKETLAIPGSLYVINFISTNLEMEKSKVKMMVPNDGFSPLWDEIVNSGDVVIETGSNHRLEVVNLNTRLVALLRYAVNQVENNNLTGTSKTQIEIKERVY
jgi:hypothetical protein